MGVVQVWTPRSRAILSTPAGARHDPSKGTFDSDHRWQSSRSIPGLHVCSIRKAYHLWRSLDSSWRGWWRDTLQLPIKWTLDLQYPATVLGQLVEPQNEASLTVSNMCVAVLPIDSRGARLFVFASKKLDEYGKVTNQLEAAKKAPSESSFSSSDRISSGSLSRSILHDIAETTAQEELPEGRTWQQENSKHVEVSKDLKLRVYVFTLSLECYGPIRKTRGYPIRR